MRRPFLARLRNELCDFVCIYVAMHKDEGQYFQNFVNVYVLECICLPVCLFVCMFAGRVMGSALNNSLLCTIIVTELNHHHS